MKIFYKSLVNLEYRYKVVIDGQMDIFKIIWNPKPVPILIPDLNPDPLRQIIYDPAGSGTGFTTLLSTVVPEGIYRFLIRFLASSS